MRNHVMAIAVCLLAACTAQTPRQPPPDPLATRQAAANAFKAYITAISEGDVATARAFYDSNDGFHWIERHQIAYTTGPDAANAITPMDAGPGKTILTIEDLRVAELSPHAAFVSAQLNFTMIMPGGDYMVIPVWMSAGMAEREDGWKLASGITLDD